MLTIRATSILGHSTPPTLREMLETLYACQVRALGEPWDDDSPLYEAVQFGRVIRADSLPLLISALGDGIAQLELAA